MCLFARRVKPYAVTEPPLLGLETLWDHRLDGGCLDAFLAVYIDGGRRIVIGGAIRYGGVGIKRRPNQADVNLRPVSGVGAAVDVVAHDIVSSGCIPVEVHDVIGR